MMGKDPTTTTTTTTMMMMMTTITVTMTMTMTMTMTTMTAAMMVATVVTTGLVGQAQGGGRPSHAKCIHQLPFDTRGTSGPSWSRHLCLSYHRLCYH